MNQNETIIDQFYAAFQKKDVETMQGCYADSASFSDPVFQNLSAAQTRKMWEMLIKRGKDLQLEYSNVQADGQRGSADWVATYSFSATGRKVINRIHAEFVFENGKIVQHRDHFNFYTWARQALGFPGWLFGWTGFLRQSVRMKAMSNLAEFMRK